MLDFAGFKAKYTWFKTSIEIAMISLEVACYPKQYIVRPICFCTALGGGATRWKVAKIILSSGKNGNLAEWYLPDHVVFPMCAGTGRCGLSLEDQPAESSACNWAVSSWRWYGLSTLVWHVAAVWRMSGPTCECYRPTLLPDVTLDLRIQDPCVSREFSVSFPYFATR